MDYNDRLRFRAFVECSRLKPFMVYDVAVFGGRFVGVNKDNFETQLQEQGFTKDEIKQIEDRYCSEFCDNCLQLEVSCVGQSTGLKDKNGNLIYEGDILRFKRVDKPVVIVYYKNRCAFVLKHSDGFVTPFMSELNPNVEIIGNVYENPELIE